MTLDAYLREEGLTHREFADRIGCEQPTVTRFVNGRRIPSPDLMRAIADKSGGRVTADDFFGTAPAEAA